MKLVINTDGACPGNPGPMTIGVVIKENGKVIKTISKPMGQGTNNRAEYLAVITALEAAIKLDGDDIIIKSDSNLLINQLNLEWKVKDKKIKALFDKVKNLEKKFKSVTYQKIPREENEQADKLANQAL